ncbi:MAG: MFS transporter [Flavobacteriales bacterium]|nr:MFS transporter [Flavobacteriales bacterium]
MEQGDPRIIRAWTMYDWANSAYSLTITSAIFPIYYAAITIVDGFDKVADRFGIPADSMQSYALSLGFLIVALIAPLLSGIADSKGNKLAYLKGFCYLGAASCMGLFFFTFDHLLFGLLLFMLACVGFSGSLIFYDAFLPEIAVPADHDKVSARGYIMGYIGSVLLLIINLIMVQAPQVMGIDRLALWLGGVDAGGLAARLSFLSVGVWWALWAQIPFAALPKRTRALRKDDMNAWVRGYRELRKVWWQLAGTVRLKRYLAAFFVFNMGIQTVMYLAVAFATREIRQLDGSGNAVPIGADALIISILVIQLVAAVGAWVFTRLSTRFGNLKALRIGVAVWVGICIGAYFTHWASEFYVLAAFVGLVMGGCQSLSRSTYAKFLPETEDHASYFSFYDVSYYLGTVLGTLAYGLVNQITGDLRNTVIAIGTFFVVGSILLLRVPDRERPAVA